MNEGTRARFETQTNAFQLAIQKAFDDLSGLWSSSVDGSKRIAASADSMVPYFRVGQLLGQFRILPADLISALRAHLSSLKEGRISQQKNEIGNCNAECLRIFEQELPGLRQEREKVQEALDVARRQRPLRGWRGSRGEFGFYLLPSLLLVGAEIALAQQITQEALLLANPLIFSLALASLTLAFKFLADRFFVENDGGLQKAGLYYLGTMLLLFVGLMYFVASLRTQKVVTDFADARMSVEGVAWTDEPNGGPNQRHGGASPTSTDPELASRSVRLLYAFYISALLFPMLSGAGFSRAFRALDRRAEHKHFALDLDRLETRLTQVEASEGALIQRLSELRQRSARAIGALGPSSDSLAGFTHRLLLLVRDPTMRSAAESQASHFLETPSAKSLASFLSTVRGSNESDGFIERLQIEHLVGLLEVALAARDRRDVDLLAEELFTQIRGQIESGFRYGKVTGFEIFDGDSQDKLLRLVDLQKYHERFFASLTDDNGKQAI